MVLIGTVAVWIDVAQARGAAGGAAVALVVNYRIQRSSSAQVAHRVWSETSGRAGNA
jgi:hypothetical protein